MRSEKRWVECMEQPCMDGQLWNADAHNQTVVQ